MFFYASLLSKKLKHVNITICFLISENVYSKCLKDQLTPVLIYFAFNSVMGNKFNKALKCCHNFHSSIFIPAQGCKVKEPTTALSGLATENNE